MIKHYCDYCGKEAADWHRDILRDIELKVLDHDRRVRKLIIEYHIGGNLADALCDDCVPVLIREAADAYEAHLKKERERRSEYQRSMANVRQ